MSKTDTMPQLPWLDLWQYSTELPLVMAGPLAPLMAFGLAPNEWTKIMSTYASLPMVMTQSLADPADD